MVVRTRFMTAALSALVVGLAPAGPQPGAETTTVTATVDAGTVMGSVEELWRDHYDLGYTQLNYDTEPAFLGNAKSVSPRTLRISIGRWEKGATPPRGGVSDAIPFLRNFEREFYRGQNTVEAAEDPANYRFDYLDRQLEDMAELGVEAFLTFDYMPYVLASEQDPANENNLYPDNPGLSFSNGIRTSPPLDPAVYAVVVRNTMRHVRGLFAGTKSYGLRYFQIGNEPDLHDQTGYLPYFWTGTWEDFYQMYAAVTAETDADADLAGNVNIGAGSFHMSDPDPKFLTRFLTAVATNGDRLDFVSYHSYGDTIEPHMTRMQLLDFMVTTLALDTEVICAEWGRFVDSENQLYDRIEHGLFRAKVIFEMQQYGIRMAHAAVLRDPARGSDFPGIIRTGPSARKPAADVVRALTKFNPTDLRLLAQVDSGHYVLAAKSTDERRVVAAYVADDPGASKSESINLTVTNLPWTADGRYLAVRYEVSEQTWQTNAGVKIVDVRVQNGNSFSTTVTYGPGTGTLPSTGRIAVWELSRL